MKHQNGDGRSALKNEPARLETGESPVLITGGAGFIGTNMAHRHLSRGRPVWIYDNLSRSGVSRNVEWLRRMHGDRVRVIVGDVRDREKLRQAVRGAGQVYHLAAQVAVTSSLNDPMRDFEINARGTLNLLEALRALDEPPPLVFASTNKVYGNLSDVPLRLRGDRYEPTDEEVWMHGFSEKRPLDFHSPYGCSKGAAGQYVLDYARTFGLRAVVFHMSCVYGPHQFGSEDQGWVAHFLNQAIRKERIFVYGDGRQVRDILYVEDLMDAFLLAMKRMDELSGQVFNLGGGPGNTVSLLELLDYVSLLQGKAPEVCFNRWRPADQQYYVSDTRKFRAASTWTPKISVGQGLKALYEWLLQSRGNIGAARSKRARSLGVEAASGAKRRAVKPNGQEQTRMEAGRVKFVKPY